MKTITVTAIILMAALTASAWASESVTSQPRYAPDIRGPVELSDTALDAVSAGTKAIGFVPKPVVVWDDAVLPWGRTGTMVIPSNDYIAN